jgi:hypothetical protein
MSGIDDLMAQSKGRWASAARRAQGLADNGLGEAVKAYYRLYLPIGFGLLISVGTLGATLVFGEGLASWPSYLRFGFLLAALGVVAGGFIYNARKVRPAAEVGRSDVMLSLEGHEQKHVRRQVFGKASIEPEHLVVTRGAAVQLRKNLATQLIMAPMLPLIFIPQSVPGSSDIWWLMAIGVGVQAIAIVFLLHEFRQAGRFLSRTADQSAASDA